MRLNSKVTWGLAWAGLAVVLAVPSADYLTGQFGAKASTKTALLTSTTDPVKKATTKPVVTKTAAVTTKVTKTGVSIVPAGSPKTGAPVLDPVDKLIQSGKPLPDYISSGTTASTKSPATTPVVPDETQVATIEPATPVVAPIPFPARPPDLIHSGLPRAGQPAPPIVEEDPVVTGDIGPDAGAPPIQLDVPNVGPVPPAGLPSDWRAARDRKLTKYLEQQGLIDGASADGRSSASVTIVQRPSPNYDPDGFYLSDGPNNGRNARRARVEQLFNDDDDDSGFTLF